jgi:predicted O-methyltransferase YrrM
MNNISLAEWLSPMSEILHRPEQESYLRFLEEVGPRLIQANKPLHILETGSMHTRGSRSFTLLFGHLAQMTSGRLTTVDIDPVGLQQCRDITQAYANSITYVCQDSVTYMESLSRAGIQKLDLLILDSWDLNVFDPLPSQIHHLRELLAVVKDLKDCVVVVDDNFLPGSWVDVIYENGSVKRFETGDAHVGKGTLIRRLLMDWGWVSGFEGVPGHNNIHWFYPPANPKQ